LRAYVVASGALEVYLYTRILPLFSAVPFALPTDAENSAEGSMDVDLTPHLTNSSLQTHRGEEGVRLFSELVGCNVLSHQDADSSLTLTAEHIDGIIVQMGDVLAETFKAAVNAPVHFQVRYTASLLRQLCSIDGMSSPSQTHSNSMVSTLS
jgi:tubulin--tyrosine ligase